MKKLTLVLALTIFGTLSFGQSQRIVLNEEFTQASCGPCASLNPAYNALLQANNVNLDNAKVTSIKYQVSWPGVDPMNAHNPTQVSTRTSYYSVGGVPEAVLDGNVYQGSPSGVTQSKIDNRYNTASPFTIDLTHTVTPAGDSLYVTAIVTATQAVSGNLRLHLVVVEQTIEFTSPPGSNGETEFFNVMKRMLPSSQGTTLASSFAVNDQYSFSESWKLANVYELMQLGVVAFIQDNSTKEVHQSAYSTPKSNLSIDVAPKAVIEPGAYFCGNSVSPVVTIVNRGNSNLTTLDINYQINGGAISTYNWTGNLAFLEQENVTLTSIGFTPLPTNTLSIYTSNPNGTTDENTLNDAINYSFSEATEADPIVYLALTTDGFGYETSWDLTDGTGTILYSGSNLNSNTTYNETFVLSDIACYKFTIYDSYGDGITGSGFYSLTDYDGTPLGSGSDNIGSKASHPFEVLIGCGGLTTSSSTDASCLGVDGTASVTVAGGTSPYTYIWSNGQITSTAVNLSASSYTVTVIDAFNCTYKDTVLVSNTSGPSLSILSTDNVCATGSTALIQLTVSGGAGNYTYMWSNGQATKDISGLVNGTYIVTVTDGANCISLTEETITSPDPITTSTVVTTETAGNDGAIDITVSGGLAPYTFLWSNGETTEDITGLVGGVYNVTITDGFACSSTQSFTVGSKVEVGIASYTKDFDYNIYPNPFTNSTTIEFTLERAQRVSIDIFNLLGKRVYTQDKGILSAGEHKVIVNGAYLNNGVYFVDMKIDGFSYIRKVVHRR